MAVPSAGQAGPAQAALWHRVRVTLTHPRGGTQLRQRSQARVDGKLILIL